MIVSIISIGNSKGIRIPKAMLEESGVKDTVELKVKKGDKNYSCKEGKKV